MRAIGIWRGQVISGWAPIALAGGRAALRLSVQAKITAVHTKKRAREVPDFVTEDLAGRDISSRWLCWSSMTWPLQRWIHRSLFVLSPL